MVSKLLSTRCRVVIAPDSGGKIRSDSFRKSEWTDQEVGYAISGKECLILPLVVTDGELTVHGFLNQFQALKLDVEAPQHACHSAVKAMDVKLGLGEFRKDVAIKTFADSQSFAKAKENADSLIRLAPFSTDQARRIAHAAVSNDQIYLPNELKRQVSRLLRGHIEDFDEGLRNQFHTHFS